MYNLTGVLVHQVCVCMCVCGGGGRWGGAGAGGAGGRGWGAAWSQPQSRRGVLVHQVGWKRGGGCR